MDRITRRLIEQYQDGDLKGKPLNLLDLARLGFPENEVDRADFLDYLERAINRNRLTQCDEIGMLKEKIRQGMSLTEIANAYVPVPVISPDEFRRFLEHSEPYEPPLNLRLVRWCTLSAAPTPAPALPSPEPAAPLVDPQARSGGDSEATVEYEMRSRKGKELADLQHAAKNQWYANQEELAESRWEAGCSLRHDQMADELMKTAPPELKISRDTLMARLRKVLEEIGKPELIRGIKKS